MSLEKKNENRIFTIPNLLSVLRIILIIPLVIFFLNKHYIGVVLCVVVSGLSDMFDGIIARAFNQVTRLGKILDPIADKLTLVAIIICVGILIPNVRVLVIILASKDIVMLIGGAYLIHRNITPPASKWYGKLATVIFYISITVIVGIELIGGAVAECQLSRIIITLLAITSVAMIFSLLMYSALFFNLLRENKKMEQLIKENK